MFLNRSPIICVKAACLGHRLGRRGYPAQTRVSYEKIRKRALQDHDTNALIGLKLPAKFVELLRQQLIEKIYRRVIDADKCDPGIELEPEAFVVRVSHGRDSISVTVPDGRSLSAGRLLMTWGVRSAVLQTTQFLEQENERFVRPSRRLPKAHLAGSIRGDVGFGRTPNLR
jgi:hypothetical protein